MLPSLSPLTQLSRRLLRPSLLRPCLPRPSPLGCPSLPPSRPLSSPPSIWDPLDITHILSNNREWVARKKKEDPGYFTRLNSSQKPKYLLIGCSDSRVGAQEIMGLDQGELFIHRNIANQVLNSDLSVLSVLYYGVMELGVEDIFVLGHYNCGGIRAATGSKDLGMIEHWLRNIRDVARLHNDELSVIKDPEERHRRLVELNVQEQCVNLFGNAIIQQAQSERGRPRVHGMVYDIGTGELKHLDIDFKKVLKKYRDIYAVHDFSKHRPKEIGGKGGGKGGVEAEEIRRAFDEVDDSSRGWITKGELQVALGRFGDEPSDERLDEAFRAVGMPDADRVDARAFDSLVRVFTKAEGEVLVVVSVPGDNAIPFKCGGTDTVGDIKEALSEARGGTLKPSQMELLHDGKVLRDEATLEDCGLETFAEIEQRVVITPDQFSVKGGR